LTSLYVLSRVMVYIFARVDSEHDSGLIMTLSKRTILVVVSTFMALLFILAVTSDLILLKSFATLEQTVLAGNVQAVRNEIDETYDELFASAKDISSDVTKYGAIRVSELDIKLLFNHRLDIVACFSKSGAILSYRAADFHKSRLAILPEQDIKQIGTAVLQSAKAPDGILKGILLLGDRPLQLVLRPIQDTGVLLLIGRYLDVEEIRRVKTLSKIDLSLVTLSGEIQESDIIGALADFERGVAYPSKVIENGGIAGYTLFRDLFDRPVVIGRVTEQRLLFDQGKATIIYVISALFLTGGVFCCVMLIFIRGTILNRLESLGATVKKISVQSDISSRLPVSDEKDELTDLARSINSMLDSLESAETAMRESEERYRMLFERAPDAIIIIGMDGDEVGQIVAANQAAAEQHGYTVQELCSMTIFDINTTETNKFASTIFEQVARGEWVTAELWHRKKNGSRFPIEVHAGPIKIKGRNYLLGFDRDITSRILAEEADKIYMDHIAQLNTELTLKTDELAAANTELEAFNYSVSHDMRGPLTRISGYCQILLEDDPVPDPQTKSYISRIHESGAWLNDMIDAMLHLAQLKRSEFIVDSVNLSRIAEMVIGEFVLLEPDRRVQTVIAPDVVVSGDPRLLEILMTNLLNNAWKYSSRQNSAKIEFGIAGNDQVPVYFVRDNGAGFNMADAGKLFRVFTRLHDPAEFSGTGVGLATVQRIIARHGGRIWAEGEIGRGATFFFTLQPDPASPVIR
jgi:PAS domain S-box-containing protein